MTRINITPDKSLIKKLGLTGYRTGQAISELVDNSIDARIAGTPETIEVRLNFNSGTVEVSDNGSGMGMADLRNALTIAKETKKKGAGLGHLGIGMKSACATLGRSFRITTAKRGSDTEYSAEYDEAEWLGSRSADWTSFEIRKAKKKDPWHGTRIAVSKLNIPLYPNQVTSFKRSFGIRYGPYLHDRRITLRINSRKCSPVEPDMEEGSKREINITLSGRNRLTGWIGLLKKRSVGGDFGIHLYRKNRLIRAFDKFGIRPHPEIAKIIGEIHLDHVPVNFHKTGFLEDSPEYRESVDAFRHDPAVIGALRSSARRKATASEVSAILESVHGEPKMPIDTRMSAANARALLRGADAFSMDIGSGRMDMRFLDGDSALYSVSRERNSCRVNVSRDSNVFRAFKNPLFLIGLIRIEAEVMMGNPPSLEEFLQKRNGLWNDFIARWSPAGKPRPREERPAILPSYSLAGELVDLHDFLKDRFPRPFQFTLLSTLSPFLHNAYNAMIYHIHTVRGAGQELHDVILDYGGDDIHVLHEPDGTELKAVIGMQSAHKIIVIRERAESLASTWSRPEKAWLDLHHEIVRKKLPLYHDELSAILDAICGAKLASPTRIRSIARRRKVLDRVIPYLEEAY